MKFDIDTLLYPFQIALDLPILGPFMTILITHVIHLVTTILILPIGYAMALYNLFQTLTGNDSRERPTINWQKEIVLITGGAGGVGKCLAERVADTLRPRKVIVLDIVPCLFDPVYHDRIVSFVCDVSDPHSVNSVAAKIFANHGVPTVIVNNAGVMMGKMLLELKDEEIMKTVSVNLLGQFWIARAFLPKLIAYASGSSSNSTGSFSSSSTKVGHIITVASLLGHITSSKLTDYCASKHGAVGFHDSLHSEINALGLSNKIATTIINPGYIATKLFQGFEYKYPFFCRTLTPEDVVDVVVREMKKRSHSVVFTPFFASLAPYTRTLPLWMVDMLRNVSGAEDSMSKVVSASASSSSNVAPNHKKKK